MMEMSQPLIKWVDNDGNRVDPPRDADEWVAVIREASPLLTVVLVESAGNTWHLATADDPADVELGSGPYESRPVDRKDEVRTALLHAGKPVD